MTRYILSTTVETFEIYREDVDKIRDSFINHRHILCLVHRQNSRRREEVWVNPDQIVMIEEVAE